MGGFLGYHCSVCGEAYGPDDVTYTCPSDGGNLEIELDFDAIRRAASPGAIAASHDFSIWRYEPLLPVQEPGREGSALRAVGWTPLLSPPRLAASLGLERLWLKDDGRNPTASFKDRASAVVVARALAVGAGVIVTASTGNAGAALAGMGAAAGIPTVILAPKTAPPAKVAQLLIFGAHVFLVEGTYDDAFDLSLQAAEAFGWYCRNTGYNPFTAEGKKTASFEICEQLAATGGREGPQAAWLAPDAVFVSVGDGNIIHGLHKGFRDLFDLGWIERLPRLYGVQARGSAAVYNAFVSGGESIQPVRAGTLADSISVDLPRDGLLALRAARQTDGAYLVVEDVDILAAMRTLGREGAVFAEPAAATSFAGLVQAVEKGLVRADEHVVAVITGSGLKDVDAALDAAGRAVTIEPTLSALEAVLAKSPWVQEQ